MKKSIRALLVVGLVGSVGLGATCAQVKADVKYLVENDAACLLANVFLPNSDAMTVCKIDAALQPAASALLSARRNELAKAGQRPCATGSSSR